MGRQKPKSIAEAVRSVLDSKPCVQDCMRMNLINSSALARMLCEELETRKVQAVNSAIRRYQESIEKTVASFDKRVNSLIAKSSVSMRNDTAVVSIPSYVDWHPLEGKVKIFHVITGDEATNLVVDEKDLPLLEKLAPENVEVRKNLAAITINSPSEITRTPGVLVHLLYPLSFNNINMEETMSCYTGKIILVKREDANKAFDILSELIEHARKAVEKK